MRISTRRHISSQYSIFALAIAGLSVFVVLWSYNLPFPLLADDVVSLVQACRLTSVEYGTLYELAYCGVVRLSPTYVIAFDIKQIAVIICIGVLMIRLAETYGINRTIAACMGLWVILSIASLNGAAYAALIIVLLGAIVAKRYQRWQWLLFPIFLAAAFLVRTEYFLGLCVSIIAFALNTSRLHSYKQRIIPLLPSAALTLFCFALFAVSRYLKRATPTYIPREWFAFGQHFAEHYQIAFSTAGYTGMEWPLIVQRVFPHSHSVFDAVRENPTMFGWHVWFNVRTYLFPAIAGTINPLPFGWWTLVVVTVLGVLFVLGTRVADNNHRVELIPLVIVAVVPTYSILIVQPKVEYLLPTLPLLVVLGGRGLTYCLESHQRALRCLVALCAALLLIGFATQLAEQMRGVNDQRASFRADIAAIQTDTPKQPFRVLGSWYANRVCALTRLPTCQPINFLNELAPGQTNTANSSLAAFIRNTQPDWVIVGEDWQSLSLVQDDPELHDWHTFLANLGCKALPPTKEGVQTWRCSHNAHG